MACCDAGHLVISSISSDVEAEYEYPDIQDAVLYDGGDQYAHRASRRGSRTFKRASHGEVPTRRSALAAVKNASTSINSRKSQARRHWRAQAFPATRVRVDLDAAKACRSLAQ